MSDGIEEAPDGSMYCGYCGGPVSTATLPHVKVTEVVGWARICSINTEDGSVALCEMVPASALLPGNEDLRVPNPRGRWRITVEFTPDE